MAESGPISIRAARSLSADELAQVRRLKALCDAAEGLDLKLSYGLDGTGAEAKVGYDSVFLALAGEVGDTLVGYCSLDGDWENAELCGLVHPDWQRQRVGFRLFEAARASFSNAGGRQLFAICEDASASGRSFVRMLAGQRAFSEHRMLWRGEPASAASSLPSPAAAGEGLGEGAAALIVARARPEDFAPLAEALALAFDQTEERLHADLASAAALETDRLYVARLDGVVIGGFRLSRSPDSVGIYAFGVDPRYQRQGWGRRMLARACALVQDAGAARVTLEVDTDNAPAIALYQSSGFETITTYGYYTFSRTLLAFGLDLDETGHMRESPDADQ